MESSRFFAGRPTREDVSRRGLAPAQQAGTASPAARRFFAALTSRSCRPPQPTHAHSRTSNGKLSARLPQSEHVQDEGNHRSTTINSRLHQAHLHSSIDRIADHDASAIARASSLFLTKLLTGRLDHDRVVLMDEPSDDLVRIVPPPISSSPHDARDFEPGLVTILRSLFLTRKFPLRLRQPPTHPHGRNASAW